MLYVLKTAFLFVFHSKKFEAKNLKFEASEAL